MSTVGKTSVKITKDGRGRIDKIIGKYTNDVDIITIDNLIKKKLSQNIKELANYIKDTKELIEEYKKIGVKERIIDFSKRNVEIIMDEEQKKRLQIIARYFFQIETYVSVNVMYKSEPVIGCRGCGRKLEIENESGVYSCEICGYEKLIFSFTEEIDTHHNSYNDKGNFEKALARYQGKIEPDHVVINNIMERLDEYFISYSKMTGEQVRALPLLPNGKKKGTSREMMFNALQFIKRPIYEHVNVICAKYWNWSIPDVTHLEEQISKDYDETQRVYDNIPKDRKSSINTQFRLFKHLQLVRHKCKASDFRIVKTLDSKTAHEELWKKMVEGAGIPHIIT